MRQLGNTGEVPTRVRRVLTIAGSDSGAGAGVQADLKAIHALGAYATTAVTALTAQNTLGVQATWPVPLEMVGAQIRSVLTDIGADAIKTGMLASGRTVLTVLEALVDAPQIPLVVDPVLASSGGEPLLDAEGVTALRELLLPRATVVTPNLAEAELLTGLQVRREDDLVPAAIALLALGPRWVLITGGHLPGEPVDLLTDGSSSWWLRGPRAANPNHHGTGCALAAALAAGLATGHGVPEAAREAKAHVAGALAAGFPLGAGPGTLDHGWATRPLPR